MNQIGLGRLLKDRTERSRKMFDNNLFTDIYKIREKLYGEDSSDTIMALAHEVYENIESKRIPERLRYLLFKTTNYCNSDCEYCSHAINRIPKEQKFNIPHEVIMRTIEEAAEMGVDAISISGGEPLIRNDMVEIIAKTVECGIVPVLLTNGLLLNEKWDYLGQAGLRYIIISIDSIDKDIYEKQRGADFNRAVAGIEAALKMREKYRNVEIHVSTVLTKDNQEDFLKLLEYMNARQIKVQISPYHKREDDSEDYSIVDCEKIKNLPEKLIQLKKEGHLIANSIGFLKHLPDFFCSNKVMPDSFECKVGYTSLAIDAYMNVKPCWSFMYEPIGNLQNNSLYEIWNSEKMQNYRKKMIRSECEGCWYLCTSEVCMMIDNILGEDY